MAKAKTRKPGTGEAITWEEFRNIGALWWVNRALHLFGLTIEVTIDSETKKVTSAQPVKHYPFRGFQADTEAARFKDLTRYLAEEMPTLVKDVES